MRDPSYQELKTKIRELEKRAAKWERLEKELLSERESLRSQNVRLVRTSIDLSEIKRQLEDRNYELRQIRSELKSQNINLVKKSVELSAISRQLEDKNWELEESRRELEQTLAELGESEEKYRTILENSEDGYYEVDIAGNFTFFNDSMCRILGYPHDEMMGMNNRRYMDRENAQKVYQTFNRTYRSGRPAKGFDWEMIRRGGTKIFVETSVSVIRDVDDRPVGFRGILRDVTERRRAAQELEMHRDHLEELVKERTAELVAANENLRRQIEERQRIETALRRSEERYRAVLEHTGTAMSVLREDTIVAMVNGMFERISGYSRDEIEGKMSWKEFVDRDDLRRMAEYHDNRRRGEEAPSKYEFVFIDRFGNRRHVVNTVAVLPGTKMSVSSLIDITDRIEAELSLRESETRYHDLFESISDMIFTHDIEGRLLTVNPAAAHIFGSTAEQLIGRSVAEMAPPRFRQAVRDEYLAQVKRQGRLNGVTVFQAVDGAERYVEYHSTLIRPPEGEPYVSVSGRDITERLLAEQDLRNLQEQLIQSQKMQVVGVLASGIAHDFNNILQAVSGYVQLMLAGAKTPAGFRKYLSEIDGAMERAADLVRRLLTFSRKVDARLGPVNLNRGVVQTIKIVERTLPRMVRIGLDLDSDLNTVNGDPAQLEQVLLNLVTNASDAMPDGGHLTIQTRNVVLDDEFCKAFLEVEPGEYVLLRVCDTGHGMDDETLSHIFEPFFTTKSPDRGTGLGLSSVYGIVKSHDGHITCRTRPGQGTTFDIYLPTLKSALSEETVGAPREERIQGGDETILLVDDEKAILEIGQDILERYGYSTMTARNGEEALEAYRANRDDIDLVILDLSMPGIGGFMCLGEILKVHPGAAVLIASGYSAEGRVTELIRAGARGFVAKPYRLVDLVRKVREVLDDKA